MDINKIVVLANELGGVDEVAELLGVDEDLLQFAIEGGELSFIDDARIQRQLSDFITDEDAQQTYGIDIDTLFGIDSASGMRTGHGLSDLLDVSERRIDDTEANDNFRFAVAMGRIDLDDLGDFNHLLANAPRAIQDKLLDYMLSEVELDEATGEPIIHTAADFLQLYRWDDMDLTEVVDSYFWEWFRDTFYGD